jgi:uncharacterized protein
LFFKALFFTAVALAQVPVPPLKARVTDLTGTLNQQQRAALEQTLAEFESRKGSQIAVLLVPTTKPEAPVEYGVRVFDSWKLGRKGIDDGVLLLVAKEDRRVWIVTGRGVEGALPDAIVKRIVEEDITPRFKQGDFYGGIRAGADRMMRLIEGEKFPVPHASPQMPRWLDPQMLFIAFILVLILGGILRTIFGRLIGAGVIGSITAVAAWLILSSLAIGATAGVIAFLITLVNSGRGGSGGWSSGGGGWSSGGGGFSSGGGGFSGGGGGTSGGGAGGSW